MYPSKQKKSYGNVTPCHRKQGGFLLPLALFLLVGMAALGLTINHYNSQSAAALTQEAVSTSAFYAAESGGQFVLNRIFYSTSVIPVRTVADANCLAINGMSLSLTAPGLNGCRVDLQCSVSSHGLPATVSFYQISSKASCGSGPYTSSREVELSSVLR